MIQGGDPGGPVSMTGFATRQGENDGWRWVWDMRGVNGRGLDLRFRLPDWIEGLEAVLRPLAQGALARGNVQIALRIHPQADSDGPDTGTIQRALDRIAAVEDAAMARGVALAPCRAIDVLNLRTATAPDAADPAPLRDALAAQFRDDVLPAFAQARRAEGRALAAVLSGQIDAIAALVERAGTLAASRLARAPAEMQAALDRIGAAAPDPDRLAQELALLAVKADVTEEIDRLRAHVDAARLLLAESGPVGRKLDFLTQELNREANTLCAKAQDAELATVGLDLKTVIDRMREQVQNVE
ncbi:hypothetical protein OCGS_0702 [Oceaniovalibus guishaninsula JLT2003]|uniref:YicC family protein n=1 Tax=Oceaniovalibus guishaninsula JLT2003 TaxID=1231392 RepID=K2HR51_9RHOB|nr:YicC/YloC family endoribonuclease [Oceaniovalibus guishaninsula]EKE45224.1 hypothetical protein OCGS_0702 [Oceaniovalibus guishaninsula JLT2003]